MGIKQELAILEVMENRIKVTNYEFIFGILFFFDLMKQKVKAKRLKRWHRLWDQLLWESLESWQSAQSWPQQHIVGAIVFLFRLPLFLTLFYWKYCFVKESESDNQS